MENAVKSIKRQQSMDQRTMHETHVQRGLIGIKSILYPTRWRL